MACPRVDRDGFQGELASNPGPASRLKRPERGKVTTVAVKSVDPDQIMLTKL